MSDSPKLLGCSYSDVAHVPASIESIVGSHEELILSWSRGFRAHELTVKDIQDRFAALDVGTTEMAAPIRRRIAEAQRELEMMRWGMCEAGQRGEIARIFDELERLFAGRSRSQS